MEEITLKHYRNSRLRHVLQAHGEVARAHDELFADGGRRQPRARQRPNLSCAIFWAHGKHLRRVFFKVHGDKKVSRRRDIELTALGGIRRVPCGFTHGQERGT